LHADGSQATIAQVRRSHAILMTIFHGLSAIPFEHQDTAPTDALRHIFRQRADAARFIFDLLDAGESATFGEPNQPIAH
jgi:hypothetical protein